MRRLLIDSIEEDLAFLPEKEIHHLVRVLRRKPRSCFEGITREGRLFLCRLEEKEGLYQGRILEELGNRRESHFRIVLAASLIKKAGFEWMIQKATELGVARILPLETDRSEIRLDEKRAVRKTERWQRIAEEAVKQCRRDRIPLVDRPVGLADALDRVAGMPILFFDEEASATSRSWAEELQEVSEAAAFIGPEGGWTSAERAQLKSAGAHKLSLGPRVLRAETAALAALTIVQYLLGDLSAAPIDSSEEDD